MGVIRREASIKANYFPTLKSLLSSLVIVPIPMVLQVVRVPGEGASPESARDEAAARE